MRTTESVPYGIAMTWTAPAVDTSMMAGSSQRVRIRCTSSLLTDRISRGYLDT